MIKEKDEKQKPLFPTAYIPNGKEFKDKFWCLVCRTQSVAHRCFSTFDCWVCTTCKLDHTNNKIHYEHQLPRLPETSVEANSQSVGTYQSQHPAIGNVLIYHIDNSGTSGKYWFKTAFHKLIASYDVRTRELEFQYSGLFEITCYDTRINAKSSYRTWKTYGYTITIDKEEILLNVEEK